MNKRDYVKKWKGIMPDEDIEKNWAYASTVNAAREELNAEWLAAIEEMIETNKLRTRDMKRKDSQRAYFGAKVEALNELKTRMEATNGTD